MSHLAMLGLGPEQDTVLARIRRASAEFFGFGEVPPELRTVLHPDPMSSHSPTPHPNMPHHVRVLPEMRVTPVENRSLRWRRHPQLRQQPTSLLPDAEREARAHAVRALYAAYAGDIETARHYFVLAATDESVDLCELPGFWKLPRTAMLAAAEAYDEVGRMREASTLRARVRTMFRPRALTPVPTNVTELPARKLTLSSGS